MKRTLFILSFVAIASSSGAAAADELVTEARIQTSYPVDQSFDVLSTRDALSEWAMGVGWQFDALAGLRALLLFQTVVGRLDANNFEGDAQFEWGRQKVLGGLEYGISPFAWLRPYVRGGIGYSHQFLEMYTVGAPSHDNAHDLAGFGSGGLEFSIPLPFGAFGATTQLGYLFQTPATFDLHHERDAYDSQFEELGYDDGDPWRREGANLGELDTNGVFWDIGLTFRLDL